MLVPVVKDIKRRTMTTLIIEDEKPAARGLQRMLTKMNLPAVALLHSVQSAIEWLQNNPHPDVLFLDIQLSDGLSFEIFEDIEVKSAIIFTTAYDEYALKAFKLNSIDYLLKPIEQAELETAIKKFRDLHTKTKESLMDVQKIQQVFQSTVGPKFKKRFTVKVGQHLKICNTSDIECFYSDNKTTYLHTTANRNYPIDQTLEVLEKDLNPDQFYRVSRKFFVNIQAISDIIAYTNSRLEVTIKIFW